ncbi:hypothetical protein L1049_013787 [Liquidambar formosana]|uniref:Uncharacterized protein n=1 Tax=Liquidambar formosana TaxID=63359 RepID=A0AAP0WUL7_LIQFO
MKTELKRGKKLKEEVKLWLASVQRINDEKQSIENQAEAVRYWQGSYLGKLVVEKIQEVEEHHQKGSFSDGLVVDESPSSGEMLPMTTLAGETTIKKNMEEIWDCLMNDEIRSIGVYGMGGIGKTSIMKHIHNRLLKEIDKFDNVFWVTVSKMVDVFKLQDAIACALNKVLSQRECETKRAKRLFSMLREKKRYVLILDDVWGAIDLENVGIPKPTLDNGCKIILTTRSLDVCRRMNYKNLKMELLSEGEAWSLFLNTVGQDVLHTPTLEPIIKLVAKECARLPLAIVTIGGSMKGVINKCEWRNALEELRESTGGLNDMKKVIEQLKYSYIYLNDEKFQYCLRYCTLYPEGFVIERMKLIQYLMVEGIVEGRNRRIGIDKGHSTLNKLENACLLESCTNNQDERCVKMHDLIRDMALQIMGHGFMVEAGVQLRDLPDEEHWTEDLEKVSLMHNNIREISFRAPPKCSRLSTLLLSKNVELRRIPDSFFVHMHGLKVLDLSYTGLMNLPNSISALGNLTALLLRGCTSLKRMPSLAKLRALRMLDLHWTGIEEMPQGMELLANLRWLDLDAPDIRMLPAGFLPKLSRLQHLVVWLGSETLNVKALEVATLRKLETFAGQLQDVHEFNTYVRSWQGRGPLKYLLKVGQGDSSYISFDEQGSHPSREGAVIRSSLRRNVVLRKCNISIGREDPLVLPKDIELLDIGECHYVRSLCDVSSLNNATDCLKNCEIDGCDGIECVLSSSSSFSLPSLEMLDLYNLRNLRTLFRGEGASPPPPGTFSNLKDLVICMCPKIRKLFTPELLLYLQNLEGIRVSSCEGMEEIVAGKAEREGMGVNNHDSNTRITLPKFRILRLVNLPKLKSIICSRRTMVCDFLEEIQVLDCPKLKRLPSLCPCSMVNRLLPRLFNVSMYTIENGGNHLSGTVPMLKMSFNLSLIVDEGNLFDEMPVYL